VREMTTPEANERNLDHELAALPVRDADPDRVARIRALCLEALDRSRQRQRARDEAAALRRARLEAWAATGLAALFIAAAVERALEVYL
jgi:hypothetical protein